MINVGELMIDPDFVRAFTLRRPSLGTFADEGVYSTTYGEQSLIGVIQPASPKELELLPEGSRLDEVLAIWSNVEMRVGDGAKVESDVVVHNTKSYRVIKCEPWPEAGFYKVLAKRYTP